ncbi:hypothetical protein [Lysobacter sp. FW306-1B-D06B]|uniref:hypothetical protein n=1 Tax=Lysobacter sp. FW306-1B-D06B TaxID=3140250 RepID=UPI00313FF4DC
MEDLGVDAPIRSLRESNEGLTFGWLYRRVQDLAAISHHPPASRLERWSLWAGLLLAGLGLLVAAQSWLPPVVVLWIATGCFIGEIGGLGLSVFLQIRRELPSFVRPRETHAAEMDVDFARWQDVVHELRRFPRAERESRLRFITTLRLHMGERMGMLFGGIQRLGVFPVLVALYFQFRDWKWGDWAGAFDVNLLAGLLVWAMLLLYAGGWLLVGLRSRLDSM